MSIEELIEACEFDVTGTCPASELQPTEDVRAMCAAGKCHAYDKNWSCPPACGDIEHFAKLLAAHEICHVVQTYGQLEDSFDFETMMELKDTHKERVLKLAGLVHEHYPDAVVLSAGACALCPECTYPDAPCRFPDKQLVSMEAAGLVVNAVCVKAGVEYNHGPNTMSYSSCVVL